LLFKDPLDLEVRYELLCTPDGNDPNWDFEPSTWTRNLSDATLFYAINEKLPDLEHFDAHNSNMEISNHVTQQFQSVLHAEHNIPQGFISTSLTYSQSFNVNEIQNDIKEAPNDALRLAPTGLVSEKISARQPQVNKTSILGNSDASASTRKMLDDMFNETRADVADFLIQNPGKFRFTTTIQNDALTLTFEPSPPSLISELSIHSPSYSPVPWDEWAVHSDSPIVAPSTGYVPVHDSNSDANALDLDHERPTPGPHPGGQLPPTGCTLTGGDALEGQTGEFSYYFNAMHYSSMEPLNLGMQDGTMTVYQAPPTPNTIVLDPALDGDPLLVSETLTPPDAPMQDPQSYSNATNTNNLLLFTTIRNDTPSLDAVTTHLLVRHETLLSGDKDDLLLNGTCASSCDDACPLNLTPANVHRHPSDSTSKGDALSLIPPIATLQNGPSDIYSDDIYDTLLSANIYSNGMSIVSTPEPERGDRSLQPHNPAEPGTSLTSNANVTQSSNTRAPFVDYVLEHAASHVSSEMSTTPDETKGERLRTLSFYDTLTTIIERAGLFENSAGNVSPVTKPNESDNTCDVVVHGMNFIPYRIQIKGDKEGITNYTVSCYQVTLPFLLDLFFL
jgi:hypothetical protein